MIYTYFKMKFVSWIPKISDALDRISRKSVDGPHLILADRACSSTTICVTIEY